MRSSIAWGGVREASARCDAARSAARVVLECSSFMRSRPRGVIDLGGDTVAVTEQHLDTRRSAAVVRADGSRNAWRRVCGESSRSHARLRAYLL